MDGSKFVSLFVGSVVLKLTPTVVSLLGLDDAEFPVGSSTNGIVEGGSPVGSTTGTLGTSGTTGSTTGS